MKILYHLNIFIPIILLNQFELFYLFYPPLHHSILSYESSNEDDQDCYSQKYFLHKLDFLHPKE